MKKTLLALGVAGLGSLLATPAFAQTYSSGSSTIVLMNGASQSVGAEVSLPSGTYFTGGFANELATPAQVDGAVVVTPALEDETEFLAVNEQAFAELVVDPGLPDSIGNLAGFVPSSFTQAAADALVNAADLQEQVSIIRAGAGVDGLE
ncbi:hypothetical protein [Cyanobacterium aponinum]|uniref:Uncharacterized protein n=1 Tax=Cyanobacterium aponinum (strain PCC 10605) TaxID=755178 RepID=K9YZL8_CYAAP|nr:hypothetical protein [Cyanobacterium aponinum]AFZ52359.1 hypothetical protein Cyan10605_0203 [Cyanobacterium aponinum PCC 10605]